MCDSSKSIHTENGRVVSGKSEGVAANRHWGFFLGVIKMF